MDDDTLRRARLASHLFSAPAASVGLAARHMAATQAQELWGGVFALAVRTAGTPVAAAVHDAFDTGDLVRTWPMRGTLHIVAAEDVGWMLRVSADRVLRSAAARHRQLGLDADDLARAERIVRRALSTGALARRDVVTAFEADGLDASGQRAYHLILALALRGVVHWGATADRTASSTEQLLTLNDNLPAAAMPADPAAELFRRYLAGHAPASIADFAWWSGLPITVARAAARAVRDDDAAIPDDARFVLDGGKAIRIAGIADRTAGDATDILRALPSFEEYYISYADRSPVASADARAAVGPGRNGMVHPLLVRDGMIVGAWTRRGDVRLFDSAVSDDEANDAVSVWRRHHEA